MRFIDNHRERVEKVKDYADKNKVFVFAVTVIIIFLLFGFVKGQNKDDSATAPETSISQSEEVENIEEYDDSKWRFYPIDLVVLAVGGGFCTVMILREKKKAREKLK